MKINFSCPINNTGYGIASFNILKELSKLSDVTYFPIGQPSVSSQEEYNFVTSLLQKRPDVDIFAPHFKIWHQFDLLDHIGKGQYITYPFFELDKFYYFEINNLKVPDKICVSSKWAQQVLSDNGITVPSYIVPLGVDRIIFHENIPRSRTDDKYVFLNIGKWEIRKGHDILLELFNRAFPDQQDVELWILASEKTNNYSTESELAQWKNMYSDPRVKLFSGFDSQKEISQLIANSDCGLYPSRAEGWNMELLESMSMNKPVITTNYSAHTEFCNKDNSYLIDITETEKAFDGKAFNNQGNWAKIGQHQIDQIIDHMRHCYQNRIKDNINGIETAKKFSWNNSAQAIMRCIES